MASSPSSRATGKARGAEDLQAQQTVRGAPLRDPLADGSGRTWVGAFERVLGDQAEVLTQERRQRQQQQQQQASHAARVMQQSAFSESSMIGGSTTRGSSVTRQHLPAGSLFPLRRDEHALASSHFLVDEVRPTRSEATGPPPVSRASSVLSSTSWRQVLPSEQTQRQAADRAGSVDGSVFLLPSSALASHPQSEAGTDFSERSGLQRGAGSSRGMAPDVARKMRKLRCNDPACDEGVSTGADWLEDPAGVTQPVKSTGPPLVAVLGPPGVALDELYLNHAPGLQRLILSNLTPGRVQVRLDSDLGDAVSFMSMKTSPNDEQDLDCVSWPTNSVAWARGDGLSPERLRDLRQISASLEELTSITIEGSSTITLLCLFRPKKYQRAVEEKQKRRRSARFAPSPRSDPDDGSWQKSSNTSHSSASSQASYHTSPRTTVADGQSPRFDGKEPPTPFSLGATELPAESPHLHHRSVARGQLLLSVTRVPDDILAVPQGEEEQQRLSIEFRASFCKPQISINAGTNSPGDGVETSGSLVFDLGEVIVGQEQERALCIRNVSQIDSCWQARLEDLDDPMLRSAVSLVSTKAPGRCFDMINQTPDSVFCPHWLSPFQAEHITLRFRAEQACRDFEQTITVINLHDTSNHFKFVVKASVLGVAPPDSGVVIAPADALDFGDCCGGQWTRQILVLRNREDYPVELTFSASSAADVTFEVAKIIPETPTAELSEDSLSSASSSAASHASEQAKSAASGGSRPSCLLPADIAGEDVRTPAFGSTRTPMSRAQHRSDMEPPPLALDMPALDKASLAEAEADTDALSNASQAGSRPASPELPAADTAKVPPSAHSVALSAISDKPAKSAAAGPPRSDSHLARLSHGRDADVGDDMRSVISEVTTTSQDSKRSVFAATTAQSSTEALLAGATRGPHPLSGLRTVDSAPTHRLDELHLSPGAETRVLVSYRPPKGKLDDTFSKGQLREIDFVVNVDFARLRVASLRSKGPKSRREVPCKVRSCTSFITVSPKLIDFEETNVGARKSATVSVTNHSVLTARVDVRFVSKVLSMYRDEVPIPPLQTVDLKVDFFPRRINDAYRKQITVTNLLNRDNDQIFEVRSKNVDKQRITFHTIFYRILTASGANFIDFGDVNINSTRVRSFSIVNTSDAPLALEVTTAHTEDLTLYVKQQEHEDAAAALAPRPGHKYAESEVLERASAAESSRHAVGKKGNFKERFLETMSVDSPTPTRKENATWRLAQKQAQSEKRAREDQGKPEREKKTKALSKAKPTVNLVSALKKGGKGKITLRYDSGITFKDRKALSVFEHLDLASGPPVDASRISAKSKMWQQLEHKASHGRLGNAHGNETSAAQDVGNGAQPTDSSSAKGALPKKTRAPALTGQRPATKWLTESADVSKLPLDELIAAMESQQSSLHTFFVDDPEAEERQVRTEINLQRRLSALISQRLLVTAELLRLGPREEKQVIALYTPNASTRPHVQGNARKQDSRIFLRLVDFDQSLVSAYPDLMPLAKLDKEELPVRDLMVKSTTCRSIMELGQTHINFGQMDKGESKTRKIVIQNRSEWALRFCIRKSGSIASGDIKIPIGRYGIIPGFGKREVEFIFSPSMSGQFQEKLVVENVADQDNDQTLVLKANVRKLPKFNVEPSVLSVGCFSSGQKSAVESFSVTNISSKARTFVVDVDRSQLQKELAIIEVMLSSADSNASRGALTQAEEEEIEHISQKLKIATRKGQADKVKKYESRLKELGVTAPAGGDTADAPDAAAPAAVPGGEARGQEEGKEVDKADEQASSQLKRSASAIKFSLEPGRSCRMMLQLRLRPTSTALNEASSQHHSSRAPDAIDEVVLKLLVHEAKDADETKTVLVRAQVQIDERGAPGDATERAEAEQVEAADPRLHILSPCD